MHINNDFQRNSNISHVFETIWSNTEISRIDISKKLNSYRSTVSNIINTLLENKVICEGKLGNATEKGGRKPVFISVNKDYGCVVGIELQTNDFKVVAFSFNGQQVYSKKGKTPVKTSLINEPEKLFLSIIDSIIDEILPDIKKLPMPALGITIGIPGIIDIDSGVIVRSDPFNIKNFDYKKNLGSRYGIPLFIENDAKCCAWLQCGLNIESSKNRDFLCVLTKDYSGNNKLLYPGNFKDGVGIGLSISMNGKILHGHKYALGEYVSRTWNETKKGQTGLPDAVVNSILTNDESYQEWLIDLFSTLTVFIPLLEPKAIFFHGQPENKHELIKKVIHESVPQFEAVVKKCDSEFVIMNENPYEIAQGAALMFLQKVFEYNEIENQDSSYTFISWDEVFDLHKKSEKKMMLHGSKSEK